MAARRDHHSKLPSCLHLLRPMAIRPYATLSCRESWLGVSDTDATAGICSWLHSLHIAELFHSPGNVPLSVVTLAITLDSHHIPTVDCYHSKCMWCLISTTSHTVCDPANILPQVDVVTRRDRLAYRLIAACMLVLKTGSTLRAASTQVILPAQPLAGGVLRLVSGGAGLAAARPRAVCARSGRRACAAVRGCCAGLLHLRADTQDRRAQDSVHSSSRCG